MSKRRTALVAVVALIAGAGALYAITAIAPVGPTRWGVSAETQPEKRWQAVAPGRIEACSGQIKVATAVVGVVQKVLVKTNDKVFAGEALIQLADEELRARLAAAEPKLRSLNAASKDQTVHGPKLEDRITRYLDPRET